MLAQAKITNSAAGCWHLMSPQLKLQTWLQGASTDDALGALNSIQATFPPGTSPNLEQAKILGKVKSYAAV